jgi:hypothetical protein
MTMLTIKINAIYPAKEKSLDEFHQRKPRSPD